MKHLKNYCIAGTIFVLIIGTLAHFVYEWTGNQTFVGFFFPVNESTWEHMKLIFFPMSFFCVYLHLKFRKENRCLSSSIPLGILTGTFSIPVYFYTYTGILGYHMTALDIGTFILGTLTGFFVLYKNAVSCKWRTANIPLYVLLFAVFLCFIFFTYHPPAINLFSSPG